MTWDSWLSGFFSNYHLEVEEKNNSEGANMKKVILRRRGIKRNQFGLMEEVQI